MDDLHLRAFGADVAHLEVKRDGIVEGLIVPYHKPSPVLELIHGQPVDYSEEFVPGAFDRAKAAPNRVGLTFTHSDLMPDRMGYGLSVRDSAEGAVAQWQLYNHSREQATELLETSHRNLSITFRPIRPKYGAEKSGALISRSAVHLASVAATDNPVHADARILSIREDQEALRAQQDAEAAQIRAKVDALLLLQARGRELPPAMADWLAVHRTVAA